MFEDSTFESNGRIRTRSRFWMIATLALNGSILLALILIPLIYPEALPRQMIAFLIAAPPTPAPPQPVPQQPVRTTQFASQIHNGEIFAPSIIPREPFIPSAPEPGQYDTVANWDPACCASNDAGKIFQGHGVTPVVRPAVIGPVRVSTGVEAALLLRKTVPVYPAIPRTAGIQGTVILQATISKSGTIENLRVIGGPPMLQQAAIDAVKTWVYRPYLLDGQPVEVETTVNVIFSLGR
jgi:protein TonB